MVRLGNEKWKTGVVRLTNPNRESRSAPNLEIEQQVFVDIVALLWVLCELFCQLLDDIQCLNCETGGRGLLEKSTDCGWALREEEDLLVGGAVVQHGEKKLQE